MKRKKWISLLLAATLSLSLLSGCGDKKRSEERRVGKECRL